MQTIKFSTDLPAILKEIVAKFDGTDAQNPAVPGIVMALNMLRVSLVKIANRAMKLQDDELLAELAQLGVIKPKEKANKTHAKP